MRKRGDMLEIIIRYISKWRRFRPSTTREALCKQLGLSAEEVREFIGTCIKLNLGWRVNNTSKQMGGIRWNEREVRPLMHH